MRCGVVLVFLCACDPGEWEAAKGVADLPARPETASRVHDVGACMYLGTAWGEGSHAIEHIARTVREGADLGAVRSDMEDKYGAPTSQVVNDKGFRVFTWDTKDSVVSVAMYPRGVRVTVATK